MHKTEAGHVVQLKCIGVCYGIGGPIHCEKTCKEQGYQHSECDEKARCCCANY
jgi:hypothetical protein